MWEFHTGQRIAAFPEYTREVHSQRILSLSLSLSPPLSSHLPMAGARDESKRVASVCARNKPLDNLCIPNGRYYLSSAAVNKIYKLDAPHINS